MGLNKNYPRLKDLKKVDVLKTIWLNYRLFGITGLRRLPIMIGWRTKLKGIKRGSICIDAPVDQWKTGAIRLGISQGETYPERALHTLISISGKGKLVFSGDSKIKIFGGCSILIKNGTLVIGKDCIINEKTLIIASKEVIIGDYVSIGWACQICDTNFHLIFLSDRHVVRNPQGKVFIGHNTWLANHVIIGKDSYLPPFSIVCSFSLVNKDFSSVRAEGCLFAGVPAQLKKEGGIYRLRDRIFEKNTIRRFNSENINEMFFDDDFPFRDYLNNM